jgi:uncharacterized repeat protein (TIGR01451 family)
MNAFPSNVPDFSRSALKSLDALEANTRSCMVRAARFSRFFKSILTFATAWFVLPAVHAAPQDGALRLELTTAFNFIVDSNVESPSTYAPRAAYVSAKIWNDGTVPITNVEAFVGDRINNTPGIYPSRVHTQNPGIVGPLPGGAFALTHEGGTLGAADATRTLGDIPPGGYIPVYWLISYPNLDINGNTVTGGVKPNDDLFLFYDIWARGNQGATPREVDVRRRVTMRNCISAMANKILPNTANKVPQIYQDILQRFAPAWTSLPLDGSPGTSIVTEGIWYDLGNVAQGFDNDGNLVPDQNAWLQPVGDPTRFDASAFRLVNTYALVVVKLKSGGEQVYDVSDQLYFSNLPDNNGVIGLVRYDYLPLKPNAASVTTPYQMAASGFDNEKFNGDYGTSFGIGSPSPTVTLQKEVDLAVADPGQTLDYTINFTNPGDAEIGDLAAGLPLVVIDRIPAGTTYLAGSAAAGNVLPSGVSAYSILYSIDNGVSWSATEPVTASDVTDIQWILADPLQPATSGLVTFSVSIDSPYPFGGSPVINVAGLALGNNAPFLRDDAVTRLQGPLSIAGTVFEDVGTGTGGVFADGIRNGTEPGIGNVAVRLYYDNNNNNVVDPGDTLIQTTNSIGTGAFTFTNLPDGEYVIQVDRLDGDIPSGYTSTSPEQLAVTLTGNSSSNNNFGFAPTLLVTKSGTPTAYPGQPVQYNIGVSNNYPEVIQTITYTGYATATDPNHTPTQNNQTWTNNSNILGNTPATHASALFGNARKSIGPTNFNIAPQASSITAVDLTLMGLYRTGANFDPSENFTIEVIQKPSTVLATYTINSTQLNALPTTPNGVDTPINITAAKGTWAWADFGPTSNITIKLSTVDRTGAATGTINVSGTRITLTTNQTISPNTLSLVPLTDTYNADELQFVSATPAPNNASVSGSVGTLTWNNLGPILPGASTAVTLNFIAKPLPGINPITTTDTARVTGAQFLNGDPANDGEATAETEILPTSSIGDSIFVDANRSGSQDLGEPGIPGVVVELYQGNTLVATDTTDASGNYLFTDLIPGTYTIRVVTATGVLVGYTLSSDPDLDGVPFDPLTPDPLGDSETTAALAPGEFFAGADFGYIPPGATLSGIVWIDFNDDGIVDPSEIGIQFVTVELYNASNTLVATSLTDAAGAYSFAGLADGSYRVVVVTTPVPAAFPAGLAQSFDPDGTEDNETPVVIIAAADVADVNFGYLYSGTNSLSGTIGQDGDPADGLLNGTLPSGVAVDELAYAGVTVFLYSWNDDDDNNLIDSGESLLLATTTTDGNGDYSFAGLPASEFYLVSIGAPLGNLVLTTTAPSSGHPASQIVTSSNSQGHTTGAYAVVPTAATITNADFAFLSVVEYDFGDLPNGYATLLPAGARHIVPSTPNLFLGSGVSTEANGQPSSGAELDTLDDGVSVNGIWTTSSGGGAEVTVTGSGWLVGFVDFNNNGNFLDVGELVASQAVTPGTSTITFNVPPNSFPDAASAARYARFRLLPSQPFVPELAFTGEAINGEVEDYLWSFHAITGTVFADADSSSTFSPGDVPVDGVVVGLYLNSVLVASRVTGLDGFYSFSGLPANDYEVRMTPPAGGTAILDADGSANGNDIIDVTVAAATVTGRDFLVDANTTLSSLSGSVFMDADGDALFSVGDQPYPSVSVTLFRDLNTNGSPEIDEEIGSVLTGSNGGYLFPNLADGPYLVVVSAPAFTTAILDADGAGNGNARIAATLAGADVTGQDFLLDSNATLSGTIRIDENEDNSGDVPHPGVTVSLLNAANQTLATTTTDSNGFYLFGIAVAGDYKVLQTLPSGFFAVADIDGGLLTINGDVTPIPVADGAAVTGQDFVNREEPTEPDVAITGNVFEDLNRLTDNTVNGTGTNAGGIFINLVNPLDNTVIASLPVNADGTYLFTIADGVQTDSSYLLILTTTVSTVGQPLTQASLPTPWISIGENLGTGPGSDGTPDGILAVSTSLAPVENANFGLVRVPDVAPVVTAIPNVMTGATPFSLIVRAREINTVNTNGPVVIRIPKDNRWTLAEPYDTGLTTLAAVSVQNSAWTHLETATHHVFSTSQVILADGALDFGIRCTWNAGLTQGIFTITSQIDAFSGEENRIDNNSDAEKLEYFIN